MLFPVTFARQGKLGIQFISTSSPFKVKLATDSSHQVQSGDELVSILNEDGSADSTTGLSWDDLLERLKIRPVTVQFFREQSHALPQQEAAAGDNHTLGDLTQSGELPSMSQPVLNHIAPVPSEEGRQYASDYEVVFESAGPLGLDFLEISSPWKLESVGEVSTRLGIKAGDMMSSIEGISTKNLDWVNVRRLLSKRPVKVGFSRGKLALMPPSVLSFFSNEEKSSEPSSPEISTEIKFPVLKISSESEKPVSNELLLAREEISRLQSALDEASSAKESQIHDLESALFEMGSKVGRLKEEISRLHQAGVNQLKSDSGSDLLREELKKNTSEIECLKLEKSELDMALTKCIAKLQTALDERPSLIEKDVMLHALKQLLYGVGGEGGLMGSRILPTNLLNRFAEQLGVKKEEISIFFPKNSPKLTDAFVAFLDQEAKIENS